MPKTKIRSKSKTKTVDLPLFLKEPREGDEPYFQGTLNLGYGRFITIRTFAEPVDIRQGRNSGKTAIFTKAKLWTKPTKK